MDDLIRLHGQEARGERRHADRIERRMGARGMSAAVSTRVTPGMSKAGPASIATTCPAGMVAATKTAQSWPGRFWSPAKRAPPVTLAGPSKRVID